MSRPSPDLFRGLLSEWGLPAPETVRAYGAGHINDTYRLSAGGQVYILQRINRQVFQIDPLIANYDRLVPAIREFQSTTGAKISPDILPTTAGSHHYRDARGDVWRLAEFLADCQTYPVCPVPRIARSAAGGLGTFQLLLNKLRAARFQATIPRFHDIPGRIAAFREATAKGQANRIARAAAQIDRVREHLGMGHGLHRQLSSLPLRITHNDAKLENFLFREEQVLVIDLDTVMPGRAPFDFGDLVRSCCPPVTEDEPDLEKVVLRMDHFRALADGYLTGLGKAITPAEREALVAGSMYIVLEQALRFLTDYLLGDPYYKTTYPRHNLDRARNQLRLLEQLRRQREVLEATVRSIP